MIAGWRGRWARALLALTGLIALAGPARATDFPALTGRVVDAAHLLQPQDIAALDRKLAGLEAQSQRQVVVATVPDLGGLAIEDYANQLARQWKLGTKGRDDGLLMVVAPQARQMRIEVGYGLEGIVTDAYSALLIHKQVAPRFKAGDYAGGIDAAVDALISQLQLPPDEARKVAADAAKTPAIHVRSPHFSMITIVFLVMFFLILRGAFTRRQGLVGGNSGMSGNWGQPSGGWGGGLLGDLFLLSLFAPRPRPWDEPVWPGRRDEGFGDNWGSDFGGDSWGSGSGSDDGFSGGGGDFGGGGASGSW